MLHGKQKCQFAADYYLAETWGMTRANWDILTWKQHQYKNIRYGFNNSEMRLKPSCKHHEKTKLWCTPPKEQAGCVCLIFICMFRLVRLSSHNRCRHRAPEERVKVLCLYKLTYCRPFAAGAALYGRYNKKRCSETWTCFFSKSTRHSETGLHPNKPLKPLDGALCVLSAGVWLTYVSQCRQLNKQGWTKESNNSSSQHVIVTALESIITANFTAVH